MDKEKLIGLVFVREPIWNKKNKNHHNCIILNKLWKEIAEECGVSMVSAKAQWKRLRQTFIKKLSERPLKRSGDGADEDDNGKPEWPFFTSLLFLKDTCIPRITEGNFSAEESMSVTQSNPSDSDDGDENTFQAPSASESVINSIPPSPISPTTPVIKKPKKQSNTKDTVGEALIKAEQEKIKYLKRKEDNRKRRQDMVEENATKKGIDEDESFFNSILPHVKTFDPQKKITFRIKVLELVQSLMSATTISSTNVPSATIPHLTELTVRQNLPSTSHQNVSESVSARLPSAYLDQSNMDQNQEPSQNYYFNTLYPNNTKFGN